MSMRRMRHTPGLLALLMMTAGGWIAAAERKDVPDDHRISGTYELDRARGDNPERAAGEATQDLRGPQHERVYQSLRIRLEPPLSLAIDRRGGTIVVASSLGPRTTFEADGGARRERAPNGRTVTTRADLDGDRLSVSTTGNRGSDFLVTFEPLGNDGLRVTRRFDGDDLSHPVTVTSYYRRIASAPRWDLYPDPAVHDFAVPDGTRVIATMDSSLGTRTSSDGERFTMTVRSPRDFEGARIEGVLSQVNTDSSRRAVDMRLTFDSIRLLSGHTSEFDAILRSIRTPDGDSVRVDSEGGVRDAGGADERVQHGAIGAALGAVIGAIAGGGKGAAIGAVAGGAGGAILAVDGRDQLDLMRGTEVTMTAIAPAYRVSQR